MHFWASLYLFQIRQLYVCDYYFCIHMNNYVIIAPNGELVPAKIVMQPDGDYKVEYSSKYTGGFCFD